MHSRKEVAWLSEGLYTTNIGLFEIEMFVIYIAVSGVAPMGATGVSLHVVWSPERWPWFSASAFLWGSLGGVSLPAIFAKAISAAAVVLSAIEK